MGQVTIFTNKNELDLERASKKAKSSGHTKGAFEFTGSLQKDDLKPVDLTEDGLISIEGYVNGLGSVHVDAELDLDTIIKIVERYMKRLGKLKTVLEASK